MDKRWRLVSVQMETGGRSRCLKVGQYMFHKRIAGQTEVAGK